MKRLRRRLKHFLIPHRGNRYAPRLFTRETVALIAFALLIVEGVYLLQVNVLLKNEGFLASVLPAALTTLANEDRAAAGVSALAEDPALDAIAQAKADDMASKGYFAHVSPDGKTPWDFLSEAGYPYTYAGENLAEDFSESADVESAWMNSPMHRANILKQEYTRVGIGVAQGMYEGKKVTFVAQYFAARRADSAAATKLTHGEPNATAIAATPATTPVETAAPRVLGAEGNAPAESNAAVAATSPRSIMMYVIMLFTAIIAFFFAITLFVHQRRRIIRIEILAGGAGLIAVALLLVIYNGSFVPTVGIPADQAARVAQAL